MRLRIGYNKPQDNEARAFDRFFHLTSHRTSNLNLNSQILTSHNFFPKKRTLWFSIYYNATLRAEDGAIILWCNTQLKYSAVILRLGCNES